MLGNPGITFNQAIDEFALCCPSRVTFLLGKYAHNHGVEANSGRVAAGAGSGRRRGRPLGEASERWLSHGYDRRLRQQLPKLERAPACATGLEHLGGSPAGRREADAELADHP